MWAWDRAAEALDAAVTAMAAHGNVRGEIVDVSNPEDIQRGADIAVAGMDGVDILLNVAGVDQIPTALIDTTLADWQRLLAVT